MKSQTNDAHLVPDQLLTTPFRLILCLGRTKHEARMDSRRLDFGYFEMDLSTDAELFISVTPAFEHGPGIQRDGLTPPRMTDPTSVHYICQQRSITPGPPTSTTNADEQRIGTWTLYHHLRAFVDTHPRLRIVAVQSNGDLTMNQWHVAYVRHPHTYDDKARRPILCGLFTKGDPAEPIDRRTYRCLVKWRDAGRQQRYEYLSLNFRHVGGDVKVERNGEDISEMIDFAVSGKTIVKNGFPLPLVRAVDKFDDLRHVFNLPDVLAHGLYRGVAVKDVLFGEHQLFRNLNERRAALFGPIMVALAIKESGSTVAMTAHDVKSALLAKRYRVPQVQSQPTNPEQFRVYPDDDGMIEIFFARAVYPFGAIGMAVDRNGNRTHSGARIVSYLSGGLSGRVGSTLEGVIDTMYDYFKCDDALVLDEGMDCALVVNPVDETGRPRYTNEQLLDGVVSGTQPLALNNTRRTQPLNKPLFDDLDAAYDTWLSSGRTAPADVFVVKPSRAQIRSVIVFAIQNR